MKIGSYDIKWRSFSGEAGEDHILIGNYNGREESELFCQLSYISYLRARSKVVKLINKKTKE